MCPEKPVCAPPRCLRSFHIAAFETSSNVGLIEVKMPPFRTFKGRSSCDFTSREDRRVILLKGRSSCDFTSYAARVPGRGQEGGAGAE